MSEVAQPAPQSLDPPVANGPAKGVVAYQVEFDRHLVDVQAAALEWGIRIDSREGKFVSAFLGCARWLGQVAIDSQASMDRSLKAGRDAAELDVARVKQLVKATEAALGQARSALINLQVQREQLVDRLSQETMPLVAERMQKALVIRLKEETAVQRFRRMLVTGIAVLVVFVSGIGFQAWADRRAAAPWEECLAHQLAGQGSNQGHYYCEVTRYHDANEAVR